MMLKTDFQIVDTNAGLNQALFNVTHGLYVLTANMKKLNGQILDALMQVTNMPPRIAIGIGKKSLTHEMIAETGKFCANAIDRADPAWMDMVKHFGFQSGRNVDKFENVPFQLGELGVPVIPEAKAFFECRVIPEMSVDLGTHMLFTAEVVRAGTRDAGEPLTYNEYRAIKFKKKG